MNEITMEEIRTLLGSSANKLSDDQVKDTYIQLLCLVETWLDAFEQSIFDGKTIQELL